MENLQNVRAKDIVQAQTVNSSCGSCQLVAQSNDIHGDGNFLQGCSFSPDGLCILTHTVADAKLRLYNTPLQTSEISCNLNHDISRDNPRTDGVTIAIQKDWTTILTSSSGDSVRCYTWYPLMNSSDPATCCFIAASR
jgi:telomerase Cajal body protein 1